MKTRLENTMATILALGMMVVVSLGLSAMFVSGCGEKPHESTQTYYDAGHADIPPGATNVKVLSPNRYWVTFDLTIDGVTHKFLLGGTATDRVLTDICK